MPITAILTPGTLTVRLQPHSTDQALQVPTLDTTGTKLYFLSDSGAAIFGGPTTAVSRTAISAMTQGLISSLQPQYPNSSYTLNVFAPAISCKSWDSATTKSFKSSLCDSFRGTWCSADTSLYLQKPGLRYMSWVHQPGAAGYNETNPPLGPLLNASEAYPFDWTAGDLLLYIAQRDYSYPENAPDVLLTCSLLNASYTADFSFQNNRQTVAVKKREFTAFSSFQAYSYTESGDPLIWSYGAMWTAFTTTFLGYMTYPVSVREGLPPTIMQTQIQNTPLNPLPDPTYSLINIRSSTTYAEMIEELFTNVTLSYFSNPALTTNSSSSPTVPVTYATYQNHYAYEPQSLWIAYGTGIGLSLLCALVGARAIIVSGATFTNSWSTIFRTTRAPELRNILDDTPEAMDGAQPTPHRVRQAVVVYLKYCGFQLASHAKSIAAGQVDFDEEQTGTEQEMTTAEESATHHSEHDSSQIASATTDAHSGIGRLDAGPTNSEAITPTMEEAHPATERVDAPSTTRDTAEPPSSLPKHRRELIMGQIMIARSSKLRMQSQTQLAGATIGSKDVI